MSFKALKPGDRCRADGFLAHEGGEATLTESPGYDLFPAVPHIAAVGSPALWRDALPGLRYTIEGTWDGELIRASDCREAHTHDRFMAPPPDVIAAAKPAPPPCKENAWDLPGLVAATGGFSRPTDHALITHATLLRWTAEAEDVLGDRPDVAVAVMCGHVGDPFPTPLLPYLPHPDTAPHRELATGEKAFACGFLVPAGEETWVTGHWAEPPTSGIRLRTPWEAFRDITSRTQPYGLFGTWAGDHMADDGRALTPIYQDYRYRDLVTLAPRYLPGAEADTQRPLAVLVGHPGERFVWHRDSPST